MDFDREPDELDPVFLELIRDDPEQLLLIGNSSPVRNIALSVDGSLLASLGEAGDLVLWDIAKGTARRAWAHLQGEGLAFHPDGTTLFAGVPAIRSWDPRTFAWQGTLPATKGPFVIATDGSQLVGTDDCSFLVHELPSGALLRRIPFPDPLTFYPLPLAISADLSTGATAQIPGRGNDVAIWDLKCGVPVKILQGDATVLALSSDGQQIAVDVDYHGYLSHRSDDRRVRLKSSDCSQTRALAFSPDDSLLAVGRDSGNLELWSTGTGELLRQIAAHDEWVSALGFSVDGSLIATGSLNRGLAIWRTGTGELVRRFATLDVRGIAVAWSPDGEHLAAAYSDHTIRIWSVCHGLLERVIQTNLQSVEGLAFSNDGTTVELQTASGKATWDAATGRPRRVPPIGVPAGSGRRRVLRAWSPDGTQVADSVRPVPEDYCRNRIVLRSVADGEVIREFEESNAPESIDPLAFSYDHRLLAGGLSGYQAAVWDVETGRLVRVLSVDICSPCTGALSPDGDVLALSGPFRNRIELWNLTSGVRIGTLSGHRNVVEAIAYSPDGKMMASIGGDAMLKVWDPVEFRLLRTMHPVPEEGQRPTHAWSAFEKPADRRSGRLAEAPGRQ